MKTCTAIILFFFFAFLFVTPSHVYAKIWINEFSSYGSSDWIELYNDGDETIDLETFRLRDNTTSNKLDLDGHIDAKGYNVFEWGTKLNNGGDTIRLLLKSDESTPVDQVIYPGDISIPPTGQTAGRQTNGGTGWVLFAIASKGSTNATAQLVPTATPVIVNTPTPVKQPTPTRVPTPTRTPTPKKEPTPTKAPKATPSDDPDLKSAKDSKVTLVKSKEEGPPISGVPTSILGIATSSAGVQPTPWVFPTQTVMVKDASTSPMFLIVAGTIFCIACGILVFLKLRKA